MKIELLGKISPLSAFAAMRGLARPFIFSGGNGGMRPRYSVVGAMPYASLSSVHGRVTLSSGGSIKTSSLADPFAELARILEENKRPEDKRFPFTGGAAGFFSYDLKSVVEKKLAPREKKGLPLVDVGFYDTLFIHDHEEDLAYLASSGNSLSKGPIMDALSFARPFKPPAEPPTIFTPGMTKKEYAAMISRALEYIEAGDVYEINLSQRLSAAAPPDAFSLYASIISRAQSRFASYMESGDIAIISNSPERLLKVEGGVAETEPIKGTRRRGVTPREDALLAKELSNSPKENAEHLMVVDLERNDLGKVCVPGSVVTSSFKRIETYEFMHHMTSTVRGRLLPGLGAVDALKALFPGGSVTGAPKVRAMEIIDELEGLPRGLYTGAIGWMDFSGAADLAVAIRTAVVSGGLMEAGAGGGIVTGSDPEAEYEETLLKARDIFTSMKNAGVRESA